MVTVMSRLMFGVLRRKANENNIILNIWGNMNKDQNKSLYWNNTYILTGFGNIYVFVFVFVLVISIGSCASVSSTVIQRCRSRYAFSFVGSSGG